MTDHPTRAVIDIAALNHNLKVIRDRIGPGRRLLAVVKANAYGHGALSMADLLQKMGVDMLGVAYTEEGAALRQAGIKLPILVMAGTLPDQIKTALETDLILTISDMDTARALSDLAFRMNRIVKIHIKVDTGMGRLGFRFEDAVEAILSVCSLSNITIEGIFTHLSTSEESDYSYTHYQIDRFRNLIDFVSGHCNPLPILHMGNSGAVIQHPDAYFDMVRVGIMLYGLAPIPELQKNLPVCPILSLKTKIIHIKNAPKGSSLSYGRSYICPSDKVIAVIPIGYSDGLARCMSGRIHVLIQGAKVPVVGTICMDMALVDITGLEGIRVGDEVVLIGTQGEESITAHDWASWQGTIPYEILCAIGPRVARIYQ
jgi:alanine racemase